MTLVGEWRVRGLLLAFTAAAFVVGVVGGGVLWQAGYRGLVSPKVLLPVAWAIELIAYALACGGRSGLSVGLALLVGLSARAAMAAGTAALWAEGSPWPEAFVRSYAQAWVTVVLQVAMAGVLVWFLADLTPTVRMIEGQQKRPRRRPSREERVRLIDELLPPGEERPEPEPEPEPETSQVIAEVPAGDEEAELEPEPEPEPELVEQVSQPPADEAASGPWRDEEEEETEEALVSHLPSADEEAPVQDAAGPGEIEEQIETAVEPASGSDDTGEEAVATIPPRQPVGAAEEEDQETSELAAVREASPVPAVVGWALAEAVKTVAGVEGLRPLEAAEATPLLVVGNAPEGADDALLAGLSAQGAAALGLLGRYGLLAEAEFAAGLFRAGGLLIVPASEALVTLWWAAPANLGLLASQGRKLSRSLQGAWPAVEAAYPELALPEAEPIELPPTVAQAAASLGSSCEAFRVSGLGAIGLLASAGCDCRLAAAASAVVWGACSELGRAVGHGGLRRLIVACGRGAAAMALAQRQDGQTFLFVRLAPQAQPGIAAAEVERLVQQYAASD